MMMVLKSWVAWTGLALIAGYFAFTHYIPLPNTVIYESLHALRISIGLVVIVAYSDVCFDALKMRRPDRIHQLSLGIVTSWVGIVGGGIWGLLWRLGGKPAWMLDSSVNGVWWWLAILGGILHVTAPGAINGVIPRPNKVRLGVGVGLGVGAALAILLLKPDLRPVVEMMEPWMRE